MGPIYAAKLGEIIFTNIRWQGFCTLVQRRETF